jgi:predicted transposase YbfD/YdcC
VLLTVKSNQKTLYRQIGCQFEGKRQIPFTASDQEKRHGRNTVWELRAKEAPEHVKDNWPGSAWIVEVITDTVERNGRRGVRRHLNPFSMRTSRCDTSVGTTPKALLRLIRQRWSIENEWHWARDAQLGEDAHRYSNRTGAPVFSFLRTIVMNLLRRGGYRSIRQGLRELAYDIQGMLALGGVATAASTS